MVLGLGAWLVLGCAMAWPQAGERVIFSDVPAATREAAPELPRRQVLPGALTPDYSRRPSLQGITETPFAPPTTSAPRRLSPRELEQLDQQRNWMFRSPDQLQLSDEIIQQRLGVRRMSETLESPSSRDPGAPRTALERFVLEPQTAEPPTELAPIRQRFDLRSGEGEFDSQTPIAGSLNFLDGSRFSDRSDRTGFANPGWDSFRDPGAQGTGIGSLEPVGARLGNANAPLLTPGRVTTFLSPSAVGELPLSGSMERSVAPRLSEVLEPINAYPDSTRRELHPVVGTIPTPLPAQGLELDPTERAAPARLTRSASLDAWSLPQNRAVGPMLNSPTPRDSRNSALKSMAVQLDVPGRSF